MTKAPKPKTYYEIIPAAHVAAVVALAEKLMGSTRVAPKPLATSLLLATAAATLLNRFPERGLIGGNLAPEEIQDAAGNLVRAADLIANLLET